MNYSVLTSALLASTVAAWLPHNRDLQAFNQTARFERLEKCSSPPCKVINEILDSTLVLCPFLSRVYGFAIRQLTVTDNRVVDGQDFTFTSEWSMTSKVDPSNADFFKKFFTAQKQLYEKPGMSGWVYWN
jgi:hypothetical protein